MKITILGANSRIAKLVEEMAIKNENIQLTLFLHKNTRISSKLANAKKLIGDATNPQDVKNAIKGADLIYASLAGDVVKQAEVLVKAMNEEKINRLIWTSSLGIYNEIPGEFGRWNQQIMGDYYHRYKLAADIIENSNLKYTIVRPAWLSNVDEIDYETTKRNQPFRGTEVSRKSVAAYIYSIFEHPEKDIGESIGINKPNTEADRPRPEIMQANGGYEPNTKEDIKVKYKTING